MVCKRIFDMGYRDEYVQNLTEGRERTAYASSLPLERQNMVILSINVQRPHRRWDSKNLPFLRNGLPPSVGTIAAIVGRGFRRLWEQFMRLWEQFMRLWECAGVECGNNCCECGNGPISHDKREICPLKGSLEGLEEGVAVLGSRLLAGLRAPAWTATQWGCGAGHFFGGKESSTF